VIEKSLQQLIKETETLLETEKKKLEEKQHKTQEEIETFEQLNITYNLVDGGKDAWKEVPILLATSKQHIVNSVNGSTANNEDEILELKRQIQLLKQNKNTFENQAKQIESLKQEVPNTEPQTKKKDKELAPLRNDQQSSQRGNPIIQHQIQTNDIEINPLQSENQKLKLRVNSLEQQVKEKDNRNMSFQTENQSLKYRIDECEQQIQAKNVKINILENKKRTNQSTPMQQTQALKALEQEKQMMEQYNANTINEIERLKASHATLEQLLKAKEDTIASLNRENLMLSTANQGNQQGATGMVETLKNLLQAKTSETELLKHNMEHLLANERRKIGALEEENRVLKQEKTRQQVTIQNTSPSNNDINPTNNDPSHHNQHGDSYNDLNYESE
jgi:chromosome segregation ATPase